MEIQNAATAYLPWLRSQSTPTGLNFHPPATYL